MVVVRHAKTFYFYFDLPLYVDENLNHELNLS